MNQSISINLSNSALLKVASLSSMDMNALKNLWQDLYHKSAPCVTNKTFLIKKLAYRLQELSYGIDPEIETEIAKHAEHYFSGSKTHKTKRALDRPLTGTRLVREYRGIEYQVSVLDEGYEYGGRKFKSLSKIATEITGSSWSGPAFFGLKQAKEAGNE